MKNIDKMKNSIIEQIKGMDLEEFKDFKKNNKHKKNTNTNNGDFDECSRNYEKYALSETES